MGKANVNIWGKPKWTGLDSLTWTNHAMPGAEKLLGHCLQGKVLQGLKFLHIKFCCELGWVGLGWAGLGWVRLGSAESRKVTCIARKKNQSSFLM